MWNNKLDIYIYNGPRHVNKISRSECTFPVGLVETESESLDSFRPT